VSGYNALFKVNPPLRRDADVHALRQAVADGTIDIIATDHAPHTKEAKECEWDNAAFGMVGLESAVSVVQTALVDTGLANWADIERLLSQTPAKIGRLNNHPVAIKVGEVADITLIDPNTSSVFSLDNLRGMSANTPYIGMQLSGSVRYTIRHGRLTLDDGVLVAPELLGRGGSRIG
jgi:dihydroorotase